MKQLTIVFALIILGADAHSQRPDPVHWVTTYVAKDDKSGELRFTATIDKPWHIYAQVQPKEAVAQPTKFVINPNPLVAVIGKPKEIGKKDTYTNKEVGITQYQYGDKVEFVQTITLKAKVKTNLSGTITYQACNDELCLPVKTIPFNIKIE